MRPTLTLALFLSILPATSADDKVTAREINLSVAVGLL